MLLPIKLLCDHRPRKDGTNAICIQYCYRTDRRTLLNTDIYIPSRYWNRKLSRISNELPEIYGRTDVLNERLGVMLRIAEDIVSFAIKRDITDPINFLKKKFRPNFNTASLENIAVEAEWQKSKSDNKTDLDIYIQIEDYSRSKEKKVCKDMPRIYRNLKEHLKAFENFRGEKITFRCLDLNFYEEIC